MNDSAVLIPDMTTLQITDDLELLLAILPVRIQNSLQENDRASELIEVIMDLGRLPEARLRRRRGIS